MSLENLARELIAAGNRDRQLLVVRWQSSRWLRQRDEAEVPPVDDLPPGEVALPQQQPASEGEGETSSSPANSEESV